MLKINGHLDSKIVALGDEMETKLIMQALDRRVSLHLSVNYFLIPIMSNNWTWSELRET